MPSWVASAMKAFSRSGLAGMVKGMFMLLRAAGSTGLA